MCTTRSGGARAPCSDARSSATPGDGARERTSIELIDEPAAPVTSHQTTGIERGAAVRFVRMVARRVRCHAPSGRELPVVVLGDYVVAPESSYQEPGLGWLELERYPRLSIEASRQLERAMEGLRMGCWPYCAPVTRWNEAARMYPGLAIAPDSDAVHYELGTGPTPVPKRRDAMDLPSECANAAFGFSLADRVRAGSQAVVELFVGVRQLIGLLLVALAVAACAYYILGTATWLWKLQDGMADSDAQTGIALIAAAAVFSATTRLLRQRVVASEHGLRRPNAAHRERTRVLQLCLDLYRAAIAMEVLALLGFLIW